MRSAGVGITVGLLMLMMGQAYAGDVAVVVSLDNAVANVSFHELVKIFKQEKQFWDGGQHIYLLMRESGGPEKEVLLKKVYQMEDDNLKKFWVAKLYRGEIVAFPKTLTSNDAVKRYVSRVPNAIGVIDSSAADGSIKVLRIDGKAPGENGYPLETKN